MSEPVNKKQTSREKLVPPLAQETERGYTDREPGMALCEKGMFSYEQDTENYVVVDQ